MLALIGQHMGADFAAQLSEVFSIERIRPGNERQRIPLQTRIGGSQPKLTEAVSLMEANIEEPLTTDDIAFYVGVSRRQQCVDVPLREHAQPRRPLCFGAAQTFSAYSRTVRSVEKKPMPAMLRSAQAFHASLSRYSASTRAWAAT